MRYVLIFLICCIGACSKSKDGVKPVNEMATINAVTTHRISTTQYGVDVNITVLDTSLTGLELYWVPGFLIGKITNPRTGHYTFTGQLLDQSPNLGAFQFNLTTAAWRYELPVFYLKY
jgi:hypothetical protein